MTTYPSRFDPTKQYRKVLWTGNERKAHAHDFNDAQDLLADRIKGLAASIFKDGGVVDGASISINPSTGVVLVTAGKVYANGIIFDVPARSFTIPVNVTLTVGICVTSTAIDYLTDTTLVGAETGTRAFGEPGADRLKVLATWTWDGEGTCGGTFYGVYKVIDGYLLSQTPPLNTIDDSLARYDREGNGNYIVKGWKVTPLGFNSGDSSQSFSISEGTINVWGYKIDLAHAYRLKVIEEPNLNEIAAEPHQIPSNASGPQTITLNHGPIVQVLGVTILEQVSSAITHGPYSGVADPLWNTSISQIVSITQSGTTYVSGRDYILRNDEVDWTINRDSNGNPQAQPSGHVEPAPGSTYHIVYQFLATVQPDSRTTTQIVVSNATPNSTVIVHYTWALPRIDGIFVDRTGAISYVKGQSSVWSPLPPPEPNDRMMIATVTNNWGLLPSVVNSSTLSLHKNELVALQGIAYDLYDLVAQERLKRDAQARNPASSRGLFVDPFLSQSLRDLGITQNAAVFNGICELPIDTTSTNLTLSGAQFLPFTEEIVVDQERVTGCLRINPYQVFDPLPPAIALDPAYDFWTVINTTNLPTVEATVTQYASYGTHQWHTVRQIITTDTTALVSETNLPDPVLRQRTVNYTITGLGPGEILQKLTFDGVDITPA